MGNGHLFASGHGQCTRRCVLRNCRTRANRPPRADVNWGHENAVAADMDIGLDHCAVFIGAVVVGSDAAGAKVHPLSDRGVA